MRPLRSRINKTSKVPVLQGDFRINDLPCRLLVWTADDWASLPEDSKPADARKFGVGWIAIRPVQGQA